MGLELYVSRAPFVIFWWQFVVSKWCSLSPGGVRRQIVVFWWQFMPWSPSGDVWRSSSESPGSLSSPSVVCRLLVTVHCCCCLHRSL